MCSSSSSTFSNCDVHSKSFRPISSDVPILPLQKAKQLKMKKEEGNAVFKSAKWQEAYDLYSEALLIDPQNKYTNAKLYFNRATVATKVSRNAGGRCYH